MNAFFVRSRLNHALAIASIGATVLSVCVAAPASGQQAKEAPVFSDGQAQVVPAWEDRAQWVHEDLWVETEFDSDHDGKRDRIHVDVTRPRATETEGLKVPVIYQASPYFTIAHGRMPEEHFWDLSQEVDTRPQPRAGTESPFPGSYHTISQEFVQEWVPRGFAVVHSESPGTGLSDGCPTVGGDNESLAPKAVIDWLNGRARAFTTRDGDQQVMASWSTGKVGMIGASYEGTLAIAAATTGVDGLATIVPISPVSSFYDYYRANGLVRSPGGYPGEDIDVLFDFINTGHGAARCAAIVRDSVLRAGQDRTTGDYNPFWASRDYLGRLRQIKATVLIAHGFNDWNTMPDQAARVYESLKARHAPVHAYWTQEGHGAMPPMTMLNRWFSHYLYGVSNGIEKDAPVWIVREGASDDDPTSYKDYPNPAAADITLHPSGVGNTVGVLAVGRGGHGRATLSDDAAATVVTLARSDSNVHRLLYATAPLTRAIHVSGWSRVTLRLASSKPAANLSVYLLALPVTIDSAHPPKLVTRGWMDPQNRTSLTRGIPLKPGEFYTLHFTLEPTDRMVPAGMRLALMVFSSDHGFTVWPNPGTKLTVDLAGTSVTVPVVGGRGALEQALRGSKP